MKRKAQAKDAGACEAYAVTLFGFEGALPPLVSWKQGVRKVFFAYCTHLIPHGGVKGWWATASCSQESKLVLIAVRVHPFPSRTRKLSSLAPKILVWRRTGKIGNANTKKTAFGLSFFHGMENPGRLFGNQTNREPAPDPKDRGRVLRFVGWSRGLRWRPSSPCTRPRQR